MKRKIPLLKPTIQFTGYACFVPLIILCLVCCSGCGSLAIDRMLAAADRGLTAAGKNDQLLVVALQQQIHAEIDQLNASLDRDIDLAASNQLKQPDGTTVAFDAMWVKQMRTGYFLTLQSKHKQLQELDSSHNKILGNLQVVRDLISQSRQLNVGYLNNFAAASNMLDRIEINSPQE